MKLSTHVILTILFGFFLLAGCGQPAENTATETSQEEVTPDVEADTNEEPAAALTTEERDVSSGCSRCADYVCVTDGTHFKAGDSERLGNACSEPRWSTSCPTIVTTTDGATWQFTGGCAKC